ncbi:threonine synthase [Halobacterium salinarum]|uniref:threonine synthase n=1 Tax=Halobacterium salinarum TaxID=2242 RepID=UPI00255290FF|nr:threonine synthase [Halobacterium salinarum]MDL0120618.1 threonine synthase [Halobacterium salinarum]
METTRAFEGLECVDCGESFAAAAATHRCPECGGILDPAYDLENLDVDAETFGARRFDSLWRYAELLPFTRGSAVSMDEGATALVPCPGLADELGVGELYIKDEGRNPTGTFRDRGQTVAMTAAAQHGASEVALASTGNAGQSAGAYAGRAGLDAHVFLPSRSGFTTKAMVNVHGGDMNVVQGRIGDANAAFEDAMDEHGEAWYSLQAFATPYRHEGKKTLLYETVEQLDWETPDHVVYPTGDGGGLVGMWKAATELRELGITADVPAMYAAQAEGCAPIVRAFQEGRDAHEPWDTPDTICGGIEIPDPAGSRLVLEALRESNGGAVAASDEEILEAGTAVASRAGPEMGATCAAAAAGAWELADRDVFGEDDTVVVVNTGTANKAADVLRSHLMSKGI